MKLFEASGQGRLKDVYAWFWESTQIFIKPISVSQLFFLLFFYLINE